MVVKQETKNCIPLTQKIVYTDNKFLTDNDLLSVFLSKETRINDYSEPAPGNNSTKITNINAVEIRQRFNVTIRHDQEAATSGKPKERAVRNTQEARKQQNRYVRFPIDALPSFSLECTDTLSFKCRAGATKAGRTRLELDKESGGTLYLRAVYAFSNGAYEQLNVIQELYKENMQGPVTAIFTIRDYRNEPYIRDVSKAIKDKSKMTFMKATFDVGQKFLQTIFDTKAALKAIKAYTSVATLFLLVEQADMFYTKNYYALFNEIIDKAPPLLFPLLRKFKTPVIGKLRQIALDRTLASVDSSLLTQVHRHRRALESLHGYG